MIGTVPVPCTTSCTRRWNEPNGPFLSTLQSAEKRLDEASRRAGYGSLGEAMKVVSGSLGQASQRLVTVPTESGELEITLGEAMSIAAIDPTTEALLDAGQAFQLDRGKQSPAFRITRENLDAIREAIGPEHRQMIEDIKSIMEDMRDPMFAVIRRLKGWTPDAVPGYWPRIRNQKFNERSGLPDGWQEDVSGTAVTMYLENAGFTQARAQDSKTPLVIRDVLSVAHDHIEQAAKITHLAEPVRGAASVINSPKVVEAIARKHGTRANADLRQHLMNASRANENIATPGGRVIQQINRNVGASRLATNPTSLVRQLGGTFRGILELGRDFGAGLKGAASISFEEMLEASPFLWDRYVRSPAGRFSPVAADTQAVGVGSEAFGRSGAQAIKAATRLDTKAAAEALKQSAAANAMKAFTKSLSEGDLAGAYRAWNALNTVAMGGINALDAMNARIFWAGFTARAKREHPEWSADQITEYAAEQTEALIRETQNSSSPLDYSNASARSRGTLVSFFTLFTSDTLKAYNRLIRASKQGKKEFAQAATGEALNIAWSVGFAGGIAKTATDLAVALLTGADEDEIERITERATDADRYLIRAASEILGVGILGPLARKGGPVADAAFGGGLVSSKVASALSAATQGWSFNPTETPASGLAEDVGREIIELGNPDSGAGFAIDAAQAINAGAALVFGNPFLPLFERFLRALERASR